MFSIQVFEPTGAEVVSFIEPGSGICWFHAGSMAKTLEFTNPYRYLPTVLEGHEYKEVKQDAGRPSLYVREEGVYMLIMESKSIYAAQFKRWLAYTVLPTIRKTGSFGSVPNIESEGSEFWQLIDGAIARNLEPERGIDLHHRFKGQVKTLNGILDRSDRTSNSPPAKSPTALPRHRTETSREDLLNKIMAIAHKHPDGVTVRDLLRLCKPLTSIARKEGRKASDIAMELVLDLVDNQRGEFGKAGKTQKFKVL